MSKDGSQGVYNLFNTESKLVTFVPEKVYYNYTDPSYNLPAFFELWALWSDTNKEFWKQTPDAARRLLADASHKRRDCFLIILHSMALLGNLRIGGMIQEDTSLMLSVVP